MKRKMDPIDFWTAAYVVYATLAFLVRWPRDVPAPLGNYLGHAVLFAVTLGMPRLRARGLTVLTEFYPVFIITFLYNEIGKLHHAVGISHDALLQRLEQQFFGGQPSCDWIRAQPWPALSWVMHSAYLGYYLIVALVPLSLWFSKRRQAARETVLLMLVTMYACYTVFLYFPVAGPRYLFPLAHNAATAIAPAVLTQRILNTGAAWGTAFPSAHVAAVFAIALSALWGWRRLGLALTPIAVLVALGTVYGQFHYALDAIAGVILSVGILALRPLLVRGITPENRAGDNKGAGG